MVLAVLPDSSSKSHTQILMCMQAHSDTADILYRSNKWMQRRVVSRQKINRPGESPAVYVLQSASGAVCYTFSCTLF